MNKAGGGDGTPAKLFQILKDNAVKLLHSICQKIWKTQQWLQDWKRSVFIPIPKKGNAKELEGRDLQRLPEMIRETCVAELIHLLLCLAGLHCLRLWRGVGGVAVAALNICGNLPFIVIQRYNRPRLKRLLRRSRQAGGREELLCAH